MPNDLYRPPPKSEMDKVDFVLAEQKFQGDHHDVFWNPVFGVDLSFFQKQGQVMVEAAALGYEDSVMKLINFGGPWLVQNYGPEAARRAQENGQVHILEQLEKRFGVVPAIAGTVRLGSTETEYPMSSIFDTLDVLMKDELKKPVRGITDGPGVPKP